ncbi:hypothetical protein ABN034_03850 [Actinopolymorpha sp. B11F2]|uniref:hypothetical protein n=1 Tax=Actinopolymorpha sp. B11F2 TaxID=3160862 RepID=UPI0032E4865F
MCLLAPAFFLGLGSEGWDRLQRAHFLDDPNFPPFGTPVVWFGAMSVASLAGSIALTQVIRRHVDALRPVRLGRILVMAQVAAASWSSRWWGFWIAARALSHVRRCSGRSGASPNQCRTLGRTPVGDRELTERTSVRRSGRRVIAGPWRRHPVP